MRELPIIVRTCGGCTACCKTHIRSDMKIKGGEYCDSCEIGKGCSIYERRPYACQVYRCAWACGKFEDSDRPDLLKVVIDGKDVEFQGLEFAVMNFWEVEKGAIDQPRVQQMMCEIVGRGHVVVARPYQEEPTYYFPKGRYSQDDQHLFIELLENNSGPLLQP